MSVQFKWTNGRAESETHRVSECLLHTGLLCVFEHCLEQQRVLGDPLVRLGLHVPQPHPFTLSVILHPLDQDEKLFKIKLLFSENV